MNYLNYNSYTKYALIHMSEAIQRIYKLHRPHIFMPGEASFIDGDEPEVHCWHCVTEIQDWYPGEPYPCPTIKALDGTE